MNVGIFLPNWIGDVVMATPALRALRRHYGPGTRLIGVMKPYVAAVLEGTHWLDEQVLYARRSEDKSQRSWSVIHQLRGRNLDTIILMPNSLSSALMGWACGARRRIGDDRGGRGVLLTDPVRAPRVARKFVPRSAVDHYLALAYAVGCPPESTALELATRPEDERSAERIWNRLGLSGRPIVAFNTGAAGGNGRRWAMESFVELAHRTVKYSDAMVLILCGPTEREAAQYIEQRLAHPRVKSMAQEDLSLGTAKACLKRSQLLVTTDSGPRHLAAAFGVPVVALGGSIDSRWTHNYNARETILRQQVPCGPCDQQNCPLQHVRCMRELTVDKVFAVVRHSLRQQPAIDAA